MKTTLGIILTLALGGIITAMVLSPKDSQTNTTPEVSNEEIQASPTPVDEPESTEKSGTITDTTVEMELKKDRGGDARGAQGKNRDADQLQNDLDNINP